MESGSGGQPTSTFILRTDAVRCCINVIRGRKIHPFFPAYLHLRQQALAQGSDTVTPHWHDLAPFLELPGGPPDKPYFRPFWNQSRGAGQEWLNRNLAGSYAGSSIRQQPLKVITYEDGLFGFRDQHWDAALEYLLYKERVPAVAVAGFFYRDFAFQTEGTEPTPNDLVTIFRRDFLYDQPEDDPDREFDVIFDSTVPTYEGEWFEPFEAEEGD